MDRILPGQNYNRDTGRYSNIGTGLGGLALRGAASFYGGPAAGAVAGRVINRFLSNRQGGQSLPHMPLQNMGLPIAPSMQQQPGMYPMLRPSLPNGPSLGPGLPGANIQFNPGQFNRYPTLTAFNTGPRNVAPSTQGVRDRGQGHSGEAARSMFEGMSNASRYNTNFDFSGQSRYT